jgi:hypothetical protein
LALRTESDQVLEGSGIIGWCVARRKTSPKLLLTHWRGAACWGGGHSPVHGRRMSRCSPSAVQAYRYELRYVTIAVCIAGSRL